MDLETDWWRGLLESADEDRIVGNTCARSRHFRGSGVLGQEIPLLSTVVGYDSFHFPSR